MNYVCKNCGKLISEEEYNKADKQLNDAIGCGCFIWLLVILFCVSVILIPIAIILIVGLMNRDAKISCPYCDAKGSLIPADTPLAQKMIKENYTPEELSTIQEENNNKKVVEKKNNVIFWIFIIFFIILCIISNTSK